jgi:hypothetical protein
MPTACLPPPCGTRGESEGVCIRDALTEEDSTGVGGLWFIIILKAGPSDGLAINIILFLQIFWVNRP